MPYRWAIKAAMIDTIVLGLHGVSPMIAAQIGARAPLQVGLATPDQPRRLFSGLRSLIHARRITDSLAAAAHSTKA